MSKHQTLRKVEDEFNINQDGRKFGANGRSYILSAVKTMAQSEQTREGIRLRELFGYFGHGRRQLAGKLALGETDVIMIKGKPVVVENVPSNVTTAFEVDDSGNVRHEQEFLVTPTGELALSMYDSGVGGWSWAVGGRDNGMTQEARQYYGMDYVNQPNYISSERQVAMMESIGVSSTDELIRHQLANQGLSDDESTMILESWGGTRQLISQNQSLESEIMMLEGYIDAQREKAARKTDALRDELEAIRSERDEHRAMMLEALGSLPVMLSEQQKQSLLGMKNDTDKAVLRMLFESLGSGELQTLPLQGSNGGVLVKPPVRARTATDDYAVDLSSHSKVLDFS